MNTQTPIFITSSDTDVGKTFISSLLCKGLDQLKIDHSYWKPIQSGSPTDRAVVERISPNTKIIDEAYVFEHPLSPDQAALKQKHEGVIASDLDVEIKTHIAASKLLVIEGVGGVCVPLNAESSTLSESLFPYRPVVFVITRGTLGTINHTCLSIEKLWQMGFDIGGIIFSGELKVDNQKSIERYLSKNIGDKNSGKKFNYFHLPSIDDFDSKSSNDHIKLLTKFVCAQKEIHDSNRELQEQSVIDVDHEYVWHPFTQHKTADEPVVVHQAKGPYLYTNKGKLFDVNCSWSTSMVGHGHPKINSAIARQQAKLDHVIFADVIHEPAAKLAKKVSQKLGDQGHRIFYSDNGSTAVEVALKMVYQGWRNVGDTKRNRFVALKGSYHGDTFGAMSVADSPDFHQPYKSLMFKTDFLTPATTHSSWVCPKGNAAKQLCLDEAKKYFEVNHESLVGLILEPLWQSAGGMLCQNQEWLKELILMAKSYGLPIILDEVFTGVGRLGKFFAYERIFNKGEFTPDVITLGKGLTGGTMTLSITAASDEIFQRFWSDDSAHALLHGHSYTANPIACVSAYEAIQILEQENLLERCNSLESASMSWLVELQKNKKIAHPRCRGSVLAFELFGSGHGSYFDGSQKEKIAKIKHRAINSGLLLRTLGNTIYLMFPLVTTLVQQSEVFAIMDRVLSEVK